MGEIAEMKIPALTGQNFGIWRDRLELYLDAHDILGVVVEELADEATTAQRNTWKKNDKKAKFYIASAVPDAFYSIIEGKRTAKAMMVALEGHFSVKSVSTQTHLKRELLHLKLSEGGDLSSHLLKFEDMIRKLAAAGAVVKKEDKISYLFLTLPEKYDAVTSVLEHLPNLTFDVARAKLLSEEVKQKSREEYKEENSSAFRGKFVNSSVECYSCGEKGHKSFNCAKIHEKKAKFANVHGGGVAMTATRKKNFVAKEKLTVNDDVVKVSHQQNRIVWTLDSGASNHMSNSMQCLDSIADCCEEINLAAAEKSIKAVKRGNLKCYNNEDVELDIQNVLYVPGLRYNLLSVKKLASNGICVTFKENVAIMKKAGQVLGVAILKNGLYEFMVRVERKKVALYSQVVKENSVVLVKTKRNRAHEASGGGDVILHEPKLITERDKHDDLWMTVRHKKFRKGFSHMERKKKLFQLKNGSLN